jgi:hypothetical protein
LDVEFVDEMDHEEILDIPWFISWGWCDNCELCFIFPSNVEVSKVSSFLFHNSQPYVLKWGPSEFEDDEIFFELGFVHKKLFHVFGFSNLHFSSIWRCGYAWELGDVMYIGCFVVAWDWKFV